jgi:hypothetical protein
MSSADGTTASAALAEPPTLVFDAAAFFAAGAAAFFAAGAPLLPAPLPVPAAVPAAAVALSVVRVWPVLSLSLLVLPLILLLRDGG